MNALAKLAIAEMPEGVRAAFIKADPATQISLAPAYAQSAANKQTEITNQVKSYPHKMAAMKAAVYENLKAAA